MLNVLLKKEFTHEVAEYTIHKKVANLICDMGFILNEEPKATYNKLIKKTATHMIVITYIMRDRLTPKP